VPRALDLDAALIDRTRFIVFSHPYVSLCVFLLGVACFLGSHLFSFLFASTDYTSCWLMVITEYYLFCLSVQIDQQLMFI
jgi:hypothetical protein